MIIGIGIDLVKSERIRKAVQKWNRRFLDRIFTAQEQTQAFAHRYPYLQLAGRFAVKEALLKALGTGWQSGIRWNEITTINETDKGSSQKKTGRPRVITTGRIKALMFERGVRKIHVSISHDTDTSIAQVILIGQGGHLTDIPATNTPATETPD